MNEVLWNIEDWTSGRCTKQQLGRVRVEVVAEANTAPALTTPTSKTREEEAHAKKLFLDGVQEVRTSVVRVILEHPGGPDQWMRENPGTHKAMAVKIVQPITENAFGNFTNIFLHQDQPGINFAPGGRLSYKNSNVVDTTPLQSDIVDVLVKETPWKKPLETSETKFREDIDKLGS